MECRKDNDAAERGAAEDVEEAAMSCDVPAAVHGAVGTSTIDHAAAERSRRARGFGRGDDREERRKGVALLRGSVLAGCTLLALLAVLQMQGGVESGRSALLSSSFPGGGLLGKTFRQQVDGCSIAADTLFEVVACIHLFLSI